MSVTAADQLRYPLVPASMPSARSSANAPTNAAARRAGRASARAAPARTTRRGFRPAKPPSAASTGPSGSSPVVQGSGIATCDQPYSAQKPTVPHKSPAAAPNANGLRRAWIASATHSTQSASTIKSGIDDGDMPAITGAMTAVRRSAA